MKQKQSNMKSIICFPSTNDWFVWLNNNSCVCTQMPDESTIQCIIIIKGFIRLFFYPTSLLVSVWFCAECISPPTPTFDLNWSYATNNINRQIEKSSNFILKKTRLAGENKHIAQWLNLEARQRIFEKKCTLCI